MKGYPKYKPSLVEWIGQVPNEWKEIRTKFVAKLNPTKGLSGFDKSSSEEVVFLPMEKVKESGEFETDTRKPVSELWNGFTYFAENDIIVAKITPCFENGKGALLENLGSPIGFGSTEFHVLRSYANMSDRKFLYNITRSHPFKAIGEAFMTGAAGQKRVPQSFIEDYLIPLPPLPEQKAIASFLNEKTKQIDMLIEKKQRMIELLKEERQAVINEAVTKGVNPKAKMKDSGIEWLGEIPEQWKVKKLKYVIASVIGGSTPSTDNGKYWDGDIPWVSAKDMKQDRIIESTDYITPLALDSNSLQMIAVGSVIAVFRSGILKHTFPVSITDIPITINQDLKAFRFYRDYQNYYVFHLFKGLNEKIISFCTKQGATVDSIDIEAFFNFKIPIPPLAEQQGITAFIDEKTKHFNTTIEKAEEAIELLQEYRTALITEVVTGKVCVI